LVCQEAEIASDRLHQSAAAGKSLLTVAVAVRQFKRLQFASRKHVQVIQLGPDLAVSFVQLEELADSA
jgi:hypothetical protein